MNLTLIITETGKEPYEVTTNLAVMIAWERKFKRKSSELAQGNVGLEDLAFMGYEACKQSSIPVPASFDGYIARLSDIDVLEREDENPTPGDHSDE